ncbi:GTPase Era [[Mycoplasma] phocae]|uniref:GTPase Era n=1 Tax=[Mycoplasma] phocae TaxID=142651 RepID=A0A2Z5IQU8_9BACT|nr:GTPase Era [[Mycoplasma] phocae]AXE61002.1 GTPase Era [[Mycoplasma] phocae]
MKKVCIVSLIGRPNVGKSTILNTLLNYDLSIVSKIAQTTRDQIRGIYNDDDYQLIFIDTPGIHKAEHLISEKLNSKSYASFNEADLLLFVTPANEEIGKGDKFIIDKINNEKITNKIAIISKIDLENNMEKLGQKAMQLKDLGFNKILGVGKTYTNTYNDLINEIKKFAYDSEPLYDEDQLSDSSLRFMAKEIIRESAIKNLYEELPHSIAVEIDEFREPKNENGTCVINATIYVKKESQKAIVVGKGGSLIKKISMISRKKMEELFGNKIYLAIRVKLNENWVDNENKITKLGY